MRSLHVLLLTCKPVKMHSYSYTCSIHGQMSKALLRRSYSCGDRILYKVQVLTDAGT